MNKLENHIEVAKLIRSKRRTITLEITHDADLIVRAPLRANKQEIEKFIYEKTKWIQRQQKLAADRKYAAAPKQFIHNEPFLYLGQHYPLEISPMAQRPLDFEQRFLLQEKCRAKARELFIDWYREQARQIITDRVQHYAALAQLQFNNIHISSAKTNWGSCGRNGNLSFSWRLVMAQLTVIDYIVVHELSHLQHFNHSTAFWQSVGKMLPNFQEHRRWLRDHGHILTI